MRLLIVMLALAASIHNAFALDIFGLEFGKPLVIEECRLSGKDGISWTSKYALKQASPCWASEKPGARPITGDAYIIISDAPDFVFHQYNEPTYITVKLIEGKIEEAFFDIHYTRFEAAFKAFTEKFGAPTSKTDGQVSTLSGGTFDNPIVTWNTKEGQVILIKRVSDIYIGTANISSTLAIRSAEEKSKIRRAAERKL